MVLFVGAFDELVLYPESHFEGLALAWILNTRIPYFLKVCFIFYVLRIATPDIFFPSLACMNVAAAASGVGYAVVTTIPNTLVTMYNEEAALYYGTSSW